MGKVTRDRPRACDSDPPAPRSRLGSKVAVQRGGQHRILASVCVAAGGGEEGPGGRPSLHAFYFRPRPNLGDSPSLPKM